MSLITRTQAIT